MQGKKEGGTEFTTHPSPTGKGEIGRLGHNIKKNKRVSAAYCSRIAKAGKLEMTFRICYNLGIFVICCGHALLKLQLPYKL